MGTAGPAPGDAVGQDGAGLALNFAEMDEDAERQAGRAHPRTPERIHCDGDRSKLLTHCLQSK